MEEKIVEIGEYTVRMTLEDDTLQVSVIDALGDEIDTMIISDDDNAGFEEDEEDDCDEEEINDN